GFNSTEVASALVHLLMGGEESGRNGEAKSELDIPEAKPARERTEREPAKERKPKKAAERKMVEERGAPAGKPELRKASRGMIWVKINAGRNDGVTPRDLVDLMTAETDLPPQTVGIIELADADSYVQVEE